MSGNQKINQVESRNVLATCDSLYQNFEIRAERDRTLGGAPWADCFTGAGVYCIFLSRVVQDGGYRRDGIEVPLPGEVSWRSYYMAGGKRIAMRDSQTDEVTWFLSDHLGSTSSELDAGGAVVGEQRYDPWGGVRVEEGLLGTDYTYTGQRSESALGLMYYVARWYDPHIAHFTQADTIVPGAGNPAAWDRYGYVENNPVNYSDPTGHKKRPIKKRVGGNDLDVTEFLALDLVATANSPENQRLTAAWSLTDATINPFLPFAINETINYGMGAVALSGVLNRFGSRKVKDVKREIERKLETKGVTLCSTESCAWVDYSTPGNIVFGYSMAQIGIDAWIYETAGGLLEMIDTGGGRYDDYNFAWWFGDSVGDNPDDYAAVQFGYELFQTYGTDLTYADLQEALVGELEKFQPPPDDFDEPFPASPGNNDYGAGYFDYYE